MLDLKLFDVFEIFKKNVIKDTVFRKIICFLAKIENKKDIEYNTLKKIQEEIECCILNEFFKISKLGINFSDIFVPKLERNTDILTTNFELKNIFELEKKKMDFYSLFCIKINNIFQENKTKNFNLYVLHFIIYETLDYKHFLPYFLLKSLSDSFYSLITDLTVEDIESKEKDLREIIIDHNNLVCNLLYNFKFNLFFLVSTLNLKKEILIQLFSEYGKKKKITKKDSQTFLIWEYFFLHFSKNKIEKKNEKDIFDKVFNNWSKQDESNAAFLEIVSLLLFSAESCGLINIINKKVFSKKEKVFINKRFIILGEPLLQILEITQIYKGIQLPFICKPLDYEIKTKDKVSFVVGGFHTQGMSFEFPYRDFKNIDISSFNTNILFEEINYLQSIPWKVNKDSFKNLLNLNIDNNLFVNELELDFKSFLNYDSIKKNIFQLQNFVKVKQFLLSLFVVYIFKDIEKFYFSVRGDSRSRLYLSGNPFNFQSVKVFRDLICSAKDEFKFLEHTFNIEWEKKRINDIILNFEKKKIVLNIKNSLIPNDATSSVFQIIGGLVGSKKLLNLTNIISEENSNEPKDIYIYVLEKMLSDIIFLEKIKKYYECFLKEVITHNEKIAYDMALGIDFLDTPENFLNKFKEFCLTRAEIKKHIMPYAYNKGSKGMIKDFLQNVYIKKFVNVKDKENFIWKIGSCFINKILCVIKVEFPEVIHLKYFFSIIVKIFVLLNEPIPISFFNVFKKNWSLKPNMERTRDLILFSRLQEISKIGFLQNYLDREVTRIRLKKQTYTLKGEKISINITANFTRIKGFDNKKLTLNLIKNNLALLPNLCQHIDALLLHGLISFFKYYDRVILPIHDSFYTNINSFIFVRWAYLEVFKTYIHQNTLKNMLYNIFEFLSGVNPFVDLLVKNMIWDEKSIISFENSEHFELEKQKQIKESIKNKELFELTKKLLYMHNTFFKNHFFDSDSCKKNDICFSKYNVLKTE
jgi:hypothetical protein